MPIPQKAPTFYQLMHAVNDQEKLSKIISIVQGPTVNGAYRHWDKVRRMRPPEGLTHEEWWMGLKFFRTSAVRGMNFLDKNGAPFKFSLVDPISEKLRAIDLSAGGTVELAAEVLTPENRDRFYISSLMEEAITSSQLEGASTTSQVAREMLSTERKPRNRDEQMIFNNYVTMRMIGRMKVAPMTKEHIFDIHRAITLDTLDNADAAGRFRNKNDGEIYVHDRMTGEIQHRPPAADALDERLEKLCEFANGGGSTSYVHPALRAIIVHFMLGYDHPFVDGNGRTARALFYWTMLHHGYWLFEYLTISPILKKSPGRYAEAFLYTETDENDLTYFILHQLDVIDKAMEALREYVTRKSEQQKVIEQKLRGHITLNHRQTALLGHAVRHPHHRYTVASHQTRHGVVHQTARTDLYDLERRGLMTRSKVGRTFYFTPAENLEKALEELGRRGD